MTNNCIKCNKYFFLNPENRKYDVQKHFLLCKKCINNIKICSKTKCIDNFALHENDLNGLKYLYIENMNNRSKFYLYEDIEQRIIGKYGNLENMTSNIIKKKEKTNKKKELRKSLSDSRKKTLIKVLEANKLEFKNHGDCYSYINYGKPPISAIVSEEISKINDNNKRRIELAKALSSENLILDESSESCYNYINNIGCKSLVETVREVEMEHFFNTKTEYPNLVKIYDMDKARQVALHKYFKNNDNKKIPLTLNTNNEIVVQFD